MVTDLALGAIAAGADGLMVEVHPNPEKAMSDGYQSLDFAGFEQLMARGERVAGAVDKKFACFEDAATS
jgi:3-deoxy-7-phosphoheptulonate synthase